MRNYEEFIEKNKNQLMLKRIFDVIVAFFLIILLSPIMIFIAIKIKLGSKGPIIYKQYRITTFGRPFVIYKFRTMRVGADKGDKITSSNDDRITDIGKKIRSYRLDELPQLFNIIQGNMSFVGARPEVAEYVKYYTADMKRTLWMPAGVTSLASIKFKDEDKIIEDYTNKGISVNDAYVNYVLPEKMKYNIEYIDNFSLIKDIKIMIKTVMDVLVK